MLTDFESGEICEQCKYYYLQFSGTSHLGHSRCVSFLLLILVQGPMISINDIQVLSFIHSVYSANTVGLGIEA